MVRPLNRRKQNKGPNKTVSPHLREPMGRVVDGEYVCVRVRVRARACVRVWQDGSARSTACSLVHGPLWSSVEIDRSGQ